MILRHHAYIGAVKTDGNLSYYSRGENCIFQSLGFTKKEYSYTGKKYMLYDVSVVALIKSMALVTLTSLALGTCIAYGVYFTQKGKTHSNMDFFYCKIYLVLQELLFIFLHAVCIYGVRKIQDPSYVRLEMIALLIQSGLFLPLISFFSALDPESYLSSLVGGIYCLLSVITIFSVSVYSILESKIKHKQKFVPNDLQEIYLHKESWEKFKKRLARNLCLENATFIEDFDNLKETDATWEQIKKLYEEYIPNCALNELNLDFKTKKALVLKYESQNLQLSDFEEVRRIVWNSITQNCFPGFMFSLRRNK